jgi:monoamine oxidase
METIEADVCVVGAGYAGLTAALRVAQAGRSVIVLEARDRIGGRVWTDRLADGTPIDRGGAWLGPGQDRLYALAAEMSVGTYPTFVDGDNLLVNRGRGHRYRGLIPAGLGWFALVCLGVAMRRIDSMAKAVPLDAPWRARDAPALDARSVASWIDSRLNVPSRTAQAMLRMTMVDLFTADPSEVSLLYVLFHLHSAGGFRSQTSIEGGVQQDRVVGGMQSIADRIAARLGDAVRLATPVREIRQDGAAVDVVADRVTVRARRAIVATPPALSGRIRYTPALPSDHALLLQRLPAGACWKIALVYDEPFWRSDGLSGESLALDSPLSLTIDGCGATTPPGILNTFACGPHAQALARIEATERRRLVLDHMRARFGPKAAKIRDYVEQSWAEEEWTRGCFMAHWAPGVLTTLGHLLREPVGRIHWAGTETSPVMHGFIDGAVRSGERAAAEVLAAESSGRGPWLSMRSAAQLLRDNETSLRKDS